MNKMPKLLDVLVNQFGLLIYAATLCAVLLDPLLATAQQPKAQRKVLFPEAFGADPTGIRDSSEAFQRALDSLPDGGTVLGQSGAHYLFLSNVYIRNDRVILDMQNALVTSRRTVRFYCEGTVQKDGSVDYLEHCIIRNIRIGAENTAEHKFAGVKFQWCNGCTAENIIKRGATGSGFSMSFCKNCRFRNIINEGARSNRGAIGFLVHLSKDSLLEDCHVADGPFYYGFQVKGGTDNIVRNSSVSNVYPERSVSPKIAFRDRGDAPWKASATSKYGLPYPFPNGSWDKPDVRRASTRTVFENIQVRNTSAIAFLAQEAIGTIISKIRVENADCGIVLNRIFNGYEHGYIVKNFSIKGVNRESIRVISFSKQPLAGVRIGPGTMQGDKIEVLLQNTLDTQLRCLKPPSGITLNEVATENTIISPCNTETAERPFNAAKK